MNRYGVLKEFNRLADVQNDNLKAEYVTYREWVEKEWGIRKRGRQTVSFEDPSKPNEAWKIQARKLAYQYGLSPLQVIFGMGRANATMKVGAGGPKI